MQLTQKETALLKDLKGQEELCIEKYRKYADTACDGALKNLFSAILSAEESHLQTVEKMLSGEEVTSPAAPSAVSQTFHAAPSSCPPDGKKNDAYLCRDALAMEKHVSSLYDVSIFEFCTPALRDTLGHIQKEEQNHGQQLYEYLAENNMYNA